MRRRIRRVDERRRRRRRHRRRRRRRRARRGGAGADAAPAPECRSPAVADELGAGRIGRRRRRGGAGGEDDDRAPTAIVARSTTGAPVRRPGAAGRRGRRRPSPARRRRAAAQRRRNRPKRAGYTAGPWRWGVANGDVMAPDPRRICYAAAAKLQPVRNVRELGRSRPIRPGGVRGGDRCRRRSRAAARRPGRG